MTRFGMASVVLALLACSGCSPGPYPFDVFQEMHYTQVQRREEPNRAPLPGDSVPTTGRPPQQSFLDAGALTSPLPNNEATLARGRQIANTSLQRVPWLHWRGSAKLAPGILLPE